MSANGADDPTTEEPTPEKSDQEQQNRSEVYLYEAPWLIYAMSWSVRSDKKHRLALGSMQVDQYWNRVEIVQFNESKAEVRSDPNLSFDHPYTPSKAMFVPDPQCCFPDLLATSSDFLRIWRISDDNGGVRLRSLLNGYEKTDSFDDSKCGPLTSFDWNEAMPRHIVTSSIDTTCTIWDIEREIVDTRLIAHDKEVNDVAWAADVGAAGAVFASVSTDGSVRAFDLRDMKQSTIIYESPAATKLVRVGWNKLDSRYMATIDMDSDKVLVLDIRHPSAPVVEIRPNREASVNAIAWSPRSPSHICTAGNDSQALIWDLSSGSQGAAVVGGLEPILQYVAGAEIEQLQWSHDCVSISFNNKLQIIGV